VAQLLLVRSLAAGVMLAPAIMKVGIATVLRPPRPGMQALRALASTVEVVFFYWSVVYLPLADAVAFYLASPIFVTLLAVVFLGETVGWRRWSAIFIGFLGVLIAINPQGLAQSGGEAPGWPALIALTGAFVFAVLNVLTRKLAGTHEITLVSWQVAAALIFGLAVAPFQWIVPSLLDWAALSLLGIVSMLAHMGVNRSLKFAPASVVVPYQYSLIVWAVLFGVIFFGDWPKPHMLIGSAIIIAAGLYIFLREQQKRSAGPNSPRGGAVDEQRGIGADRG